jgi:hypothetical protein
LTQTTVLFVAESAEACIEFASIVSFIYRHLSIEELLKDQLTKGGANMDANDVKKVLVDIKSKAASDKAFMAELIENPRGALASMGISLPPEADLVVSDQTDESIVYLNLPPKPEVDSMELSDEQMEQVAGGEIFLFLVPAVVTASSVAAIGAVGYATTKTGQKIGNTIEDNDDGW